MIHPGRNSKAPDEILRIYTEAGGKANRTVMAHLDSKIYGVKTKLFYIIKYL